MNEFKILLDLNAYHVSIIIESVILELNKLRDKNLLMSGDDSGLKSVWEEICVQVQGEESFYWEAFENSVDNIIESIFEKQDDSVKILIRYIGSISKNNLAAEEEVDGFNEDVIEEIKSKLLLKAEYYTNDNINRYLNNKEEDDEEEEEEVEEDWEEEKDKLK